jgi:hypothetical protein
MHVTLELTPQQHGSSLAMKVQGQVTRPGFPSHLTVTALLRGYLQQQQATDARGIYRNLQFKAYLSL